MSALARDEPFERITCHRCGRFIAERWPMAIKSKEFDHTYDVDSGRLIINCPDCGCRNRIKLPARVPRRV